MRYLFERAALRWRTRPVQSLSFIVESLAVFVALAMILITWGNLWQDVRAVQAPDARQAYVMQMGSYTFQASDAVFQEFPPELALELGEALAGEADLFMISGAWRSFEWQGDIVALPVLLCNDDFFRLHLNLDPEAVADGAVVTPAAWRVLETGQLVSNSTTDGGNARLRALSALEHPVFVRGATLPDPYVYGSWLQNTLSMGVGARNDARRIADGFVFLRHASFPSQALQGFGWNYATIAFVLQEGVSFPDVAPRIIEALQRQPGYDRIPLFKTAQQTMLMRRGTIWDHAVEVGVLALVLVALVCVSLVGKCLDIYKQRRAEYAVCLCSGARHTQLIAEYALEVLPPLLLSAALGYPLGAALMRGIPYLRGYALAYDPRLSIVLFIVAALLCAVALALPAAQLRRLSLPSVLQET